MLPQIHVAYDCILGSAEMKQSIHSKFNPKYRKLTPIAKALWENFLKLKCHKTHTLYYKIKLLCEIMGHSSKTIIPAINELAGSGIITKQKSHRHVSRYVIHECIYNANGDFILTAKELLDFPKTDDIQESLDFPKKQPKTTHKANDTNDSDLETRENQRFSEKMAIYTDRMLNSLESVGKTQENPNIENNLCRMSDSNDLQDSDKALSINISINKKTTVKGLSTSTVEPENQKQDNVVEIENSQDKKNQESDSYSYFVNKYNNPDWLSSELLQFGIDKMGKEFLDNAVDRLLKMNGKILNKGAYLRACIKGGYLPESKELGELEQADKAKQRRELEWQEQLERRRQQEARDNQVQMERELLADTRAKMSDEQLLALRDRAIRKMKDDNIHKDLWDDRYLKNYENLIILDSVNADNNIAESAQEQVEQADKAKAELQVQKDKEAEEQKSLLTDEQRALLRDKAISKIPLFMQNNDFVIGKSENVILREYISAGGNISEFGTN